MARHIQLGKWGEDLACDRLVALGYAIAERNWRYNHLEIDIVAINATTIVFAEVKTRSNIDEDPFEAIDSRKIANIVRAAQVYLTFHTDLRQIPQFDLFGITGDPCDYHIEHLPDAFDPPISI